MVYFLPPHIPITEMALFFVLILYLTFFLIISLDIICEQILKVGSAGLEDWLAIGRWERQRALSMGQVVPEVLSLLVCLALKAVL